MALRKFETYSAPAEEIKLSCKYRFFNCVLFSREISTVLAPSSSRWFRVNLNKHQTSKTSAYDSSDTQRLKAYAIAAHDEANSASLSAS